MEQKTKSNGFRQKARDYMTRVFESTTVGNLKKDSKDLKQEARTFAKWMVIAIITGLVSGVIGAAFDHSIAGATAFREARDWVIYLLPIGGLLIAGIYKLTNMQGVGTDYIIDSIHFGKRVPLLLVPVIFISTVVTHLVGGSAGREGAALQIGGSLGNTFGKLCKLDENDVKLATLCGTSAVFSALFGTPLTATVFALEVTSVGVVHYAGLLPCILSSLTAYGISTMLGVVPTAFTVASQSFSLLMLIKITVLAIACGIVSRAFCLIMKASEHITERIIKNTFIRAALGGFILLALTLIVGNRDYNGAGMSMVASAIEQGSAPTFAFALKIIFTAVTIAFGFRGGEIVPTFFIGATFGCIVGPLLGIPAGFAAAIGLTAIFCGCVNCPLASIIMSVELFGSGSLLYFALACGITYLLSGYFGLFKSQEIAFSKTKFNTSQKKA